MAGFAVHIRTRAPSNFRNAAGQFTSAFNRALDAANREVGARAQELAVVAQVESRLRSPTGVLARALADPGNVSVLPGGAGVRVFNAELLDRMTAKETPGTTSMEFGYWRIANYGSAGTRFHLMRPFVILGPGGQRLRPAAGAKDAVKLAQMSPERSGGRMVSVADVAPQEFVGKAQRQVLAEIEAIFARHWASVPDPITGAPGGFRPRYTGSFVI